MSSTIYALATPPGRAGVAVIRVSGVNAKDSVERFLGEISAPRYAYYRRFLFNHKRIDDVLVLYFSAPASFTGEDVVEIHCHGSAAIVREIESALSSAGLRLAEAGEFTRRALANGKMNLLQVEALGELLEAETMAQVDLFNSSLHGEFPTKLETIRQSIVEAMSLLTLSIDFSDEDIPDDTFPEVAERIDHAIAEIDSLLAGYEMAQRVRNGFEVVIVGKPNIGKSTLLNAIAGSEVAITTDIPGTTRDVLEIYININGLPVRFLDTAGLHTTDDIVEKAGIDRARQRADAADLRLFLLEREEDLAGLNVKKVAGDIVLSAKADKSDSGFGLPISGKTKQGLTSLFDEIESVLKTRLLNRSMAFRERHFELLSDGKLYLQKTSMELAQGVAEYEIAAEDLRRAMLSMDRLLGKVDVEDFLDYIFAKFCIGK